MTVPPRAKVRRQWFFPSGMSGRRTAGCTGPCYRESRLGRIGFKPTGWVLTGIERWFSTSSARSMLRKATVGASVVLMFVTTGKYSLDERGGWLVPRQELAATLQVLLPSRRLRVAPALPEVAILAREVAAFQVKVSAAAETEMDAWRQGRHEDLVEEGRRRKKKEEGN
jgi:hypothetical protein